MRIIWHLLTNERANFQIWNCNNIDMDEKKVFRQKINSYWYFYFLRISQRIAVHLKNLLRCSKFLNEDLSASDTVKEQKRIWSSYTERNSNSRMGFSSDIADLGLVPTMIGSNERLPPAKQFGTRIFHAAAKV